LENKVAYEEIMIDLPHEQNPKVYLQGIGFHPQFS